MTEAHHVFDGRDDLRKDQFGLQVVEFPSGGYPGEQVSAAAVLHDQVQLPAGVDHLVEAHYVGMAQLLHAADLGGGQRLAFLIQTRLVHDFNGDSFYKKTED